MLHGGDGDDEIYADDFTRPEDVIDALFGGAGRDHLVSDFGPDRLFGGEGDDWLELREQDLGIGTRELDGGDGSDLLELGVLESSGTVLVDLGARSGVGQIRAAGHLVATLAGIEAIEVELRAADATVLGGRGDDRIEVSSGSGGTASVRVGDGDDTVSVWGLQAQVHLGEGSNTVSVSLGWGSQVRDGSGDSVFSVGGPYGDAPLTVSRLDGGSGVDTLHLSVGADIIFAGRSVSIDGMHLATIREIERVVLQSYGGFSDRIEGLAGDDELRSGGGDDVIQGGSGNDRVFLEEGDDRGYGGDGADTLSDGLGDDLLFGGAGADRLGVAIDGVADRFDGGTGLDTLEVASFAAIRMAEENGRMVVFVGGVREVNAASIERFEISGGSADDDLLGGSGGDMIRIGRGSDQVFSRGGDDHVRVELDTGLDRVVLGTGIDTIELVLGGSSRVALAQRMEVPFDGQSGAVILGAERLVAYGGGGDDVLRGGELGDWLSAGWGNNRLHGLGGDDTLVFGGQSRIYGGVGVDTLRGSLEEASVAELVGGDYVIHSGGEVITRASGIERVEIEGTEGSDRLTGMARDDLLVGVLGQDVLSGAGGDDVLVSGGFGTRLIGGRGADTFYIYNTGDGITYVEDWGPGDRLALHDDAIWGLSRFEPVTFIAGVDPQPPSDPALTALLFDTESGVLTLVNEPRFDEPVQLARLLRADGSVPELTLADIVLQGTDYYF